MQEAITNLKAVYEALNTIQVSNHQQIKTFSNCLDMLVYTINQINEHTNQKEQEEDTEIKINE